MKNKAIQYFTDEYLKSCETLSPTEIAKFLDDFRRIHGEEKKSPSKLISMKVPEDLLEAFKLKAKLLKVPYQTQIKRLMTDWMNQ